jgi:Chemotaxis signal transduction protein
MEDTLQTNDQLLKGDIIQLVTFHLGQEEFGIDILKVREIIRPMAITMVPRSAHFIEGVINLRGRVIPIVNLRRRFGMQPKEFDSQTRIIDIELGEIIVGFIVDSVAEVLRIPANTVEDPPAIISGIQSDYVRGVGKVDDRLLILLDLDKLVASEDVDSLPLG